MNRRDEKNGRERFNEHKDDNRDPRGRDEWADRDHPSASFQKQGTGRFRDEEDEQWYHQSPEHRAPYEDYGSRFTESARISSSSGLQDKSHRLSRDDHRGEFGTHRYSNHDARRTGSPQQTYYAPEPPRHERDTDFDRDPERSGKFRSQTRQWEGGPGRQDDEQSRGGRGTSSSGEWGQQRRQTQNEWGRHAGASQERWSSPLPEDFGEASFGPQRRGGRSSGRDDFDANRSWNQVENDWGSTAWMERAGQQPPRASHAGRGPKGYRRSDERIQEEVCEALTRHRDIDASDIDVKVSQGEVTLTGTVEDKQMKYLAEYIAETVNGVHDVVNEIRMQRPSREQGQQQNEMHSRSNNEMNGDTDGSEKNKKNGAAKNDKGDSDSRSRLV